MPKQGSGRPQKPVTEEVVEDQTVLSTTAVIEDEPKTEPTGAATPALDTARPEPETPPVSEEEAESQEPDADTADLERQIGLAQGVLGEQALDPEKVYGAFERGQQRIAAQDTTIQQLQNALRELQDAPDEKPATAPTEPSQDAILAWADVLRDPSAAARHGVTDPPETPEGRLALGERLARRQLEREAVKQEPNPDVAELKTVVQALTGMVMGLQGESQRAEIAAAVPAYKLGDPATIQQLSQLLVAESGFSDQNAEAFIQGAPKLAAYMWQGRFGNGQATPAAVPTTTTPARGLHSSAAAAASRVRGLTQTPSAPTGQEPGVITEEDRAMWPSFEGVARMGKTPSFKTLEQFAAHRRKLESEVA